MWFPLNTCLYFWEPRILVHARQRAAPWSAANEDPEHRVPNEGLPDRTHLTHVVTTCGGIKHALCDSIWRGLWEAGVWSPPDLAPCTSPLADSAVYTFPVVILSHEWDHTLNPASPRKSPNLGEGLGTPGTEAYSQVLASHLKCNLLTQYISKLNLFSKSKNCLPYSIMTAGLKRQR